LVSVKSLLAKSLKTPNIITTSSSMLDVILGGGVETGCITEVSGESGLGKTQFCFQLAVNAQLPPKLGGLSSEVVFVDTEQTFSSERLVEIINGTLSDTKKLKDGEELLKGLTYHHFLSKLLVFRCLEAVELLAVVHQLVEFIKSHPKVRLIIIDSIANAIRSEELKTRTRIMLDIASKLHQITMHTKISVVVVNQVTTNIMSDSIIPALGSTWSHVPGVKILLQKKGYKRLARLVKSPTKKPAVAAYNITSKGIRDSTDDFGQQVAQKLTLQSTNHIKLQVISQDFLNLSQQVIDGNNPDKLSQLNEEESHSGVKRHFNDEDLKLKSKWLRKNLE